MTEPIPDEHWGRMLEIAGVEPREIVAATGLSRGYVYNQLTGTQPMQERVRRACEQAVLAQRREWYPKVVALVKLLAAATEEEKAERARRILAGK
jgi:hypothetical protein